MNISPCSIIEMQVKYFLIDVTDNLVLTLTQSTTIPNIIMRTPITRNGRAEIIPENFKSRFCASGIQLN